MRRIPELDALRALAALVVLLFYLNLPLFFSGWTGVDLFFVLSGYPITTIILDHQGQRGSSATSTPAEAYESGRSTTSPSSPWSRRPRSCLVGIAARLLNGLGYYVTYLQNITLYQLRPPPEFHIAFDHTWTLALEEQFYLIWPALIALASLVLWDRWGLRLARRVGPRLPEAWREAAGGNGPSGSCAIDGRQVAVDRALRGGRAGGDDGP